MDSRAVAKGRWWGTAPDPGVCLGGSGREILPDSGEKSPRPLRADQPRFGTRTWYADQPRFSTRTSLQGYGRSSASPPTFPGWSPTAYGLYADRADNVLKVVLEVSGTGLPHHHATIPSSKFVTPQLPG